MSSYYNDHGDESDKHGYDKHSSQVDLRIYCADWLTY